MCRFLLAFKIRFQNRKYIRICQNSVHIYMYYHYSPEIRRLCLMKCFSIMLHNLSWNLCSFFHFVQFFSPKLVISEECHFNAYTMYQGYVLLGLDFWSSTWLVDNILSTYIGYRLTIYCQPITYIG